MEFRNQKELRLLRKYWDEIKIPIEEQHIRLNELAKLDESIRQSDKRFSKHIRSVGTSMDAESIANHSKSDGKVETKHKNTGNTAIDRELAKMIPIEKKYKP